MRRSRLFTAPIFVLVALAALAVPSWAAEPSPAAAVCPVVQAAGGAQMPPSDHVEPLFATSYTCGSCAGVCEGLLTNTPCVEGGFYGCCLGILSPRGTPASCPTGYTGKACLCSAMSEYPVPCPPG